MFLGTSPPQSPALKVKGIPRNEELLHDALTVVEVAGERQVV